MIKFSASKIEMFYDCPYKYKLAYIDKIRTPQTAPLLFGDCVHKSYEDFHNWVGLQRPAGTNVMENKLRDICDQRTLNLPQEVYEHTKVPREQVYEVYCEEYLKKWFFPYEIYKRGFTPEYSFNIQLTDQFVLRGKIDLFVYPDIIIDFKTSKTPSTIKDLLKAFQTRIYALTIPEKASFFYLYVRKPFTERSLEIGTTNDVIRQDMIQTMTFILNTTEFTKTYHLCDWCSFKEHCLKR